MKRLLFLFILTMTLSAKDYFYVVVPVFKVEPVYEEVTIQVPHKECWTETVKDENHAKNIFGRFLGTLAGTIIGNQIGGGTGREIATITGGIIGGDIGEDVARSDNYKTIRRCKTIYESRKEEKLVGYNNYFNYNGKTYIKFSSRRLHEVKIKVTIE